MEQNTQKTALLILDMEVGILARMGDTTALLSNAAKAIAKARANNIPVIYVVVSFRPGAPEVSLNNKIFGAGKEHYSTINMNEFMQIHADIAPQANEVITVKRRVSAFSGSDLEIVLRAQGIDHIVLTGIATSGVVLSTTREAADKDYRITILSDCCADSDEEVHRVLMTKVFPRQADVLTLEEWSKM